MNDEYGRPTFLVVGIIAGVLFTLAILYFL